MSRLLADENFPLPAVEALRRLGHDVVTVEDVGRAGQGWPDADLLEFARVQNRVVVTLNRRDFLQLHRRQPDHAGMILCTSDLDFDGQGKRIADALSANPDLKGLAIRVNRPPR